MTLSDLINLLGQIEGEHGLGDSEIKLFDQQNGKWSSITDVEVDDENNVVMWTEGS